VAAGKKCGIYCSSGEQAKQYADKGFHMINVATDYTTLGAAMGNELSAALGKGAEVKGRSY
jgi:4-hydroxy-2-oxoheptanedioate aldolase